MKEENDEKQVKNHRRSGSSMENEQSCLLVSPESIAALQSSKQIHACNKIRISYL